MVSVQVMIVSVVAILVLLGLLAGRSAGRLADTKRTFWARVAALPSDADRVEYLDKAYRAMSRLHGAPALRFAMECHAETVRIKARMKVGEVATDDR